MNEGWDGESMVAGMNMDWRVEGNVAKCGGLWPHWCSRCKEGGEGWPSEANLTNSREKRKGFFNY